MGSLPIASNVTGSSDCAFGGVDFTAAYGGPFWVGLNGFFTRCDNSAVAFLPNLSVTVTITYL